MSADMDMDATSDSRSTSPWIFNYTDVITVGARSKSPGTRDMSVYSQPDASKVAKVETRPRGPGDFVTDPRAVLLLAAHQTEVGSNSNLQGNLLTHSL